jgi:urease accessory protein
MRLPSHAYTALHFSTALLVYLCLISPAAYAHSTSQVIGGFGAGFLHPLTGFDHLLAMVAVGLWGAFLGRPLLFVLPIVFPTVMAIGGVMGMLHIPLPPVELGIAASVLFLGAAIALRVRLPLWAAALAVGFFAIFHGYAHGQELPVAADPTGYSVGFVMATGLLHVLGIGLGVFVANPRGALAVRGLGGGIAAAGVYFLTKTLVF